MKIQVTCVMVLALLLAPAVFGRIILQQNFDDTGVFLAETPMTHPGFGDGTTTGGIWDRQGTGPDPEPTTDQALSGTQSIRATRQSTGTGTLVGGRTNDFVDLSVDTQLIAEFWVYRTTGASFVFNVNDNAATTPLAASVLIASDGKLNVRNYGDNAYDGTNQLPVYLPAGQWVGVRMDVDLTLPSGNHRVSYNDGSGFVLVDIHSINLTKLSHIDEVAFLPQPTVGASFYVDDVSLIAIPEPASMGLLLVGCLSLISRRRK